MRFLITLSLVFNALVASSFAQRAWLPIGNVSYNSVEKLPDGRVCISTSGGYVLWSEDDGDTWSYRQVDINSGLHSVRFISAMEGLVACDSGRIYRTTNGGASWRSISTPLRTIFSAQFTSTLDYHICGPAGEVYRTTNGGSNWAASVLNDSLQIVKLYFPTSAEGYAIGNQIEKLHQDPIGMLWYTSDAGATWISMDLPNAMKRNIYGIDRSPKGKLVITNDSLAAVTLDNGKSWKMRTLNPRFNGPFKVVMFVSEDTLVAFHASESRFVSFDGGDSWTEMRNDNGLPNTIVGHIEYYDQWQTINGAFRFVGDRGSIYELSKDLSMNASIRHTGTLNIGAKFWTTIPDNSRSVRGILTGGDATSFLISTDAGLTWKSRYEPYFGQGTHVGLRFTNENAGILFGVNGGNVKRPCYGTTDNGATWYKLDTFPKAVWNRSAVSTDGSDFIMTDSVIYHSTDAGYNWSYWGEVTEAAQGLEKEFISGVKLFGSDTGYFYLNARDLSSLAKYTFVATEDGGKSWRRHMYTNAPGIFRCMGFVDTKLGYMLGDGSLAYRTTDGGRTWNPFEFGHSNRLESIAFNRDGSIGIVGADGMKAYITHDSGYTWVADTVMRINNGGWQLLNRITFIDDTTVFIQSGTELFRKTFSSASKAIVEYRRRNPYLYIIPYPNPSASSRIKCTIYGLHSIERNSMRITLRDMLGRELCDLSQQAINAATMHTSEFEISCDGLPNGVYFITMTTNNGSFEAPVAVVK